MSALFNNLLANKSSLIIKNFQRLFYLAFSFLIPFVRPFSFIQQMHNDGHFSHLGGPVRVVRSGQIFLRLFLKALNQKMGQAKPPENQPLEMSVLAQT